MIWTFYIIEYNFFILFHIELKIPLADRIKVHHRSFLVLLDMFWQKLDSFRGLSLSSVPLACRCMTFPWLLFSSHAVGMDKRLLNGFCGKLYFWIRKSIFTPMFKIKISGKNSLTPKYPRKWGAALRDTHFSPHI